MMKNTQKKLKPKQFRYLSKPQIKTPLAYIRYFYDRYDLNLWQEKVYVFLTSGSAQFRPPLLDPFNTHRHIINHIDIAYIIHQRGAETEIANRFLDYFFEMNCRKYWLEIIDELLKNETDKNYGHDEDNYNLYVIRTIELLHYLSYYFYLLSIEKSEDFAIPLYVLPYRDLSETEKEEANCLKRLPLDSENVRKSPIPFYHKERIALPEWLAPQPYSRKAVQDFFQISSLKGWRNELWNWYQSVITDDLFWSADKRRLSGANLLYNYACFYSLLEMYRSQVNPTTAIASHSIQDNSRSIFKEHNDLAIQHDGDTMVLRYIVQEEAKDPLHTILEHITRFNKVEWDEILYDWLSYGLSSNTNKESTYAGQTTRIYQTLVKIVELSYVLAFQDEIEFIN